MIKPSLDTLSLGANLHPGGVHFRVWAPKSKKVSVVADAAELTKSSSAFELQPESDGYFSAVIPKLGAGTLYKYRLTTGDFPDPASRFQPAGPHGPSQVIDPSTFKWTDAEWAGAGRDGQVIYEFHVGTFTPEGTWAAAAEHLGELRDLGITMLEVMPVADFTGTFGWGYDGVNLFAPTRLYGTPEDFRAFVDRAHATGLAVILDVVYNHFGPEGCYLREFSEDYFSTTYKNEWGDPINFDGPNRGPVREYFAANAGYWITEFHLDGLRLDATQAIFDSSADHILALISRTVRHAGGARTTYIVNENEPQEVHLVRSVEEGGFGMDSLWNDDFHHTAIVALTGRNEAYYTDYRGSPQEFISSLKYGYLYQGQRYKWQKARRGTPSLRLHPAHFVTFIQNHDQVANTLYGRRIHEQAGPGILRAITALLLLGPNTPMLFQGQEFGASAPFLYFADHNPELARMVANGRATFLKQFPSIECLSDELPELLSDPSDPKTFQRCKLDHGERIKHQALYALHRDLLKLRRSEPVFAQPRFRGVDGAVLGPAAFVLRFFHESDETLDRLLVLNLAPTLNLNPAPEPLLAPSARRQWKTLWTSESPRYGGEGTPALDTEENWTLPGQAAVVLYGAPLDS